MDRIWFREFDLDYANRQSQDSLVSHLGIRFIAADDQSVTAQMPVDSRTWQPAGVLHGGASVALAETVATWAASFAVDPDRFHCVGMEINANHIRPVSEGFVYATATPLHLGWQTQVWQVRITDQRDKLVCICRMTAAVLSQPSGY
jgi:1,4-dihydroxy-2-naphthoyl-CoA hydrolase